jgi:outer membrane receptor protein involved in Fe transport
MYMKIFALLTGLIISVNLYAQPPGGQRQQMNGRFYGRVVDASNKGIEAASVFLIQNKMDNVTKQPQEVIVSGMLTTSNGDFSLPDVPAMARYKLRVTGIGYQTYEINVNFEMPRNGSGGNPSAMLSALDKDLGNIKLQIDEKVLEGVTVTAGKPLLQLGIDRKIFNVDRNIVSAGGTAIDVMKNVPSVSVDIDGNVTLRNNAPQIFVDGRPTNLTLEQIPADAIESVEIITNPSAKFDASGGTAGILNIVLKKQRRVGYAGNVRANIDSRARVGGGGDINIRQDKINFFAAGMVSQRKSISEGNTDRLTFGSVPTRTYSDDDNVMEGMFGFGRAGIDIFINNRNTLTFSGSMARGNMKPNNVSVIQFDSIFRPDSIRSLLNERFSNTDVLFRNYGSQVSFKHNFPKAGREWTADVTYNRGRNQNENMISTDYFNLPGKTFNRNYTQQLLNSGNNENLVIQTDFISPINDKSKYEFGARAHIRNINSSQNFFMIMNGTSTPIPSQSVEYSSEDKIYAAYGTYSQRINNFGYQLGLRAESSVYEGIVNKNQNFNIEFPISLFPSVFLSQKLSESTDLQLNYSRRINRPNFWQLFPFTDYSDSLNISRGNPNLNPEFTNSLEMSFSKTFENRDNFIASVYYKNTTDLITPFQNLEQDNNLGKTVLVNTYINANSMYVTGLELTSRNKITKFWDLTSNINFFTAKIDLADAENPEQFPSYFAKLNNTFRLPKNLTLQLSGDYTSKRISNPGGTGGGGGGRGGMWGGGGGSSAAQGYIRANYGVDAALRFEFLKNKTASLSLNVNDIFRTRLFDSYSESPFFVQNIERRRDPQVFRLNFNYRFGKFDANLFKRRNTRAESDVQMEGVNM